MLKQSADDVATKREDHREWLSVRYATLNRDIATSPKNLAVRGLGRRAKILRWGIRPAASSWEANNKGRTDDREQPQRDRNQARSSDR